MWRYMVFSCLLGAAAAQESGRDAGKNRPVVFVRWRKTKESGEIYRAAWRALEPFRRFTAEVAASTAGPERRGFLVREAHVATVSQILADHGRLAGFSSVAEQLYWTLYVGVLTFWSHDESPGQSETLALLDEALLLFARSLDDPHPEHREESHATDDR